MNSYHLGKETMYKSSALIETTFPAFQICKYFAQGFTIGF